MKVLQVNSVCGYGSTGGIVVDLYRELEAQGHECVIAYGRGTAPRDVTSYRIGTNLDVYMHGAMSRITDKHGFYSTNATRKFVKWMKEYDPDIIHLHNVHGYYMNVEVLFEALREMNKPIVWTLHDCWAFTGHCSHYTFVGCEKWKKQCYHCPQTKEYPAGLLIDNSYSNYQRKKKVFSHLNRLTIVTPSQWLARETEKSFLSDYKVMCINNGIDLQIFKPTPSDFRQKNHLENKKIILGVADIWSKRKCIDVFNMLASRLDEGKYGIVLVGTDKRSQTKIDKRILCINRTKNKEELVEIYTAADLYLNPSWEETMGLTTVEALACGTDVLVRNSTALPEVVGYDKTKIMKEENFVNQLIGKLENLSTETKNREVAMKYEKSSQYQKYVELYRELTEK